MTDTNEDNESHYEALLQGGIGPYGMATGGGLAPGVALISPNALVGVSSMASSVGKGSTAETDVSTGTQMKRKPGDKLRDKLLSGPTGKTTQGTPNSQDANNQDIASCNAHFLKYLQSTYTSVKKLETEVAKAINTKKEIKILTATLATATANLIKWSRLAGKVTPAISSEKRQTTPKLDKETVHPNVHYHGVHVEYGTEFRKRFQYTNTELERGHRSNHVSEGRIQESQRQYAQAGRSDGKTAEQPDSFSATTTARTRTGRSRGTLPTGTPCSRSTKTSLRYR